MEWKGELGNGMAGRCQSVKFVLPVALSRLVRVWLICEDP